MKSAKQILRDELVKLDNVGYRSTKEMETLKIEAIMEAMKIYAAQFYTADQTKDFGRYILILSNEAIKKQKRMKPLDAETGEQLLDDLFNKWIE